MLIMFWLTFSCTENLPAGSCSESAFLCCRSDSYTSRSSSRPNELPKLPNLPATRQKAEAYQNSKAASAAATGKPVNKKMVVAGTVTKSSRDASRAASDSGSSSSSSYTSGSTSRSNTAHSSKLPAIAASKGAGRQSVKSGATSVQQQTEVMRSNLQQSRAATSQEQARIKITIQQQLQPGRMLF